MAGFSAFVALLLLTPAFAINLEVGVQSSLSFDAEAAKTRPVSRVIALLKDMLTALEKEGEDDEDTYDKMKCWCETNDKDKSESINKAESRVSELEAKVEEHSASSTGLTAEIKALDEEVAKQQKALDQATAIRQKQANEFAEVEKDLLTSVSTIKVGIKAMSKKESLMQLPRDVQNMMRQHASLLTGVLTHSEKKAVAAFIQAPESYAPQSDAISGIMGQMQSTFEDDLASSQETEASNKQAHESLKAAKTAQIDAAQDQLNIKSEKKADVDEKLAQATRDSKDTAKSLAADQSFLAELKEKCSQNDAEWDARQKTRADESKSVSEALTVLTGDDARDLLSKTLNFIQKESSVQSASRDQATKILAVAAKQHRHLAVVASQVRLHSFTRVKKAIDDMVTQLGKEKDSERKQRDLCQKQFNTNEVDTEKKVREKKDATSKMEDLEGTVKALASALDGLNAEVVELNAQMEKAKANRLKENKEFQTTVADQRATQKLLTAALTVLKGFYDEKTEQKAALVQSTQPAGFKPYKKAGGAGGVIGLIQNIINDAKAMEVESIKDEANAQKAYVDFKAATTASIDSKNKDIVNKSESKGTSESDLVEAKELLASVVGELEELATAKAELHLSCDFVMKNMDIRQKARDEEVEALSQAKAVISGAKSPSFLQGA